MGEAWEMPASPACAPVEPTGAGQAALLPPLLAARCHHVIWEQKERR